MNIEEIDKWLDNEYGVSYTRLEELHDFLIEQNMKYQDKIDNLEQENKQLKEIINKARDILEQYKYTNLDNYIKIIQFYRDMSKTLGNQIHKCGSIRRNELEKQFNDIWEYGDNDE